MSITFIVIPIILDIVFLFHFLLPLLPPSFLFHKLPQLAIHILYSKLFLEPFDLYLFAHDFLHLLFGQLLLLHLKLVQSFVIGLKVHQFIGYGVVLCQLQGWKHLLLSFLKTLNIGDFPDVILEYVVALIGWRRDFFWSWLLFLSFL